MTVDPASRDYPYRQLADQYRAAIQSGQLGPKLPNMHVLAEQAGVSPQTVQRAISALKDEGLVEAIPGRGVFVIEQPAGEHPGDRPLENDFDRDPDM